MAFYKKYFYKICIVGNAGVGKSTLLYHYLKGQFKFRINSTIGSNFFVKIVNIDGSNRPITLQVWDHFKWVRREFYIGANGIVYVFDLTDNQSFEDLYNWKEEVEKVIGVKPNILVGNKLDLINSKNRNIQIQNANTLKSHLIARAYYETSAKLGTMVNEVFSKLALEIYKLYE